MKLTDEQANKAIKKVNELNFSKCPICNSSSLNLNDTFFEMREYNSGNLVIGGKSSVFPVVILSCNSCGHAHFFSAVLLGLLDKDGK